VPLLLVHGALRQLAGGVKEHQLRGTTVLELLRELEREHPAVCGWIVDERGSVRRHINVFVDGERGREDTAVAAEARVEILPAITGG
jgi:molybdopterin synthase sulfur carrier subunit